MDEQALKEGKDRVRRHLTGLLAGRGMVRRPGVSVADHAATLASIEARLAYLSADQLDALAEVVERHAGGKHRNRWPAEASVMNWAVRIQAPPPSDSRFVRSYMASAPGRRALEQDYVTELWRHIKHHGPRPLTGYELTKIRDEADQNRRLRLRIKGQIERGVAGPADMAWLDAYWRDRERAVALVGVATSPADHAKEPAQ